MFERNGSRNPRQWFAEAETGRKFVAALFEDALDDDDGAVNPLWPKVPGYRLFRKIASGGGGDVFLALKEGHSHPCALKLLKLDIDDSSTAQRAWRELDVLQNLHLSFVPRVLDYGVHQGRLFIASEYIDGLALDEYCSANRLSLRKRVELLSTLAGCVQRLHEQGVLHRDLKPSNLIVDKYGGVHVIDFGIAQVLSDGDQDEGLTLQGQVLGSAAYMAPEQARGDRQSVSTRTDVYGLAAIGYVILTGQPPHPPGLSRHELIRHVASQPPRDPLKLDSSLPKPIAAVLEKAASYAPEQRIATAQELSEEFQRWLRNEPLRSLRISAPRRALLAAKRRPAMSALVASLFIAFGMALYLGAIAYLTAQHATRIEALKKQQDDVLQNAALTATNALIAGKHDTALRALMILDEIERAGLANEQFREQFGMARSEFCTTVVGAAYGHENFGQSPHKDELEQVLANIEQETDAFRK